MMASDQTGSPAQGGYVLHIGAGYGDTLAAHLAGDPAGVILVEPDPMALAHLQDRTQDDPRVQVIGAAAVSGGQTGPGRLRQFNFAELNSLRAPTGLKALFPGLEEMATIPVPQVPVADLVAEAIPDGAGPNLLVIEAPGEALALAEALHAAGTLSRFEHLRLQTGTSELYEGSATLTQLRDWLTRIGCSEVPVTDQDDPDRPHLSMMYDPAILAEAAAQAEAARERMAERGRRAVSETLLQIRARALSDRDAARAETQGLQARMARLDERLIATEAARTELEDILSVRQTALADAEAQLTQSEITQKETLAAAEARFTGAETARQEALAALADAETRLAQSEAAREEAQTALTAAKARMAQTDVAQKEALAAQVEGKATLTAALAEANSRRDALERQLGQMKSDATTQNTEIAQLKQALADAQETAMALQERESALAVSRDEIARLEGQIALIRDLLLSGPRL